MINSLGTVIDEKSLSLSVNVTLNNNIDVLSGQVEYENKFGERDTLYADDIFATSYGFEIVFYAPPLDTDLTVLVTAISGGAAEARMLREHIESKGLQVWNFVNTNDSVSFKYEIQLNGNWESTDREVQLDGVKFPTPIYTQGSSSAFSTSGLIWRITPMGLPKTSTREDLLKFRNKGAWIHREPHGYRRKVRITGYSEDYTVIEQDEWKKLNVTVNMKEVP